MSAIDFAAARQIMVQQQIVRRNIRSPAVVAAMRKVPREEFVGDDLQKLAYTDGPLPIAAGQTISQPYIVAFMTEALSLSAEDIVLEIGTGCGYAAAVLAEIAREVYSVERIPALAEAAQAKLRTLGYDNVHVVCGDGTLGWPEKAPFDVIVVTAGGPRVPESLQQQLKIGGRLVIPVGAARNVQSLVRVTRVAETNFQTEDLADVRFVSLIGSEGWQE
jgi:protein-L-isoaspartate(D-aspartate) O-methyltransferase